MTSGRAVVQLARRLMETGQTIAVAESLTGGQLAGRLAAGPDAEHWFAGGVVAYSMTSKREVLGFDGEDPVTHECAVAMARAARRVFSASFGLSVTGVGGPGPSGGHPAGTVWLAVTGPDLTEARLRRLPGSPVDVLRATCDEAIDAALAALRPTELPQAHLLRPPGSTHVQHQP